MHAITIFLIVVMYILEQVEQSEAVTCKWSWQGDWACKYKCKLQGHSGGACDENKECVCEKEDGEGSGDESHKRCTWGNKLGEGVGDFACKASCKVLGRGSGACDENNKCVCSDGKVKRKRSMWSDDMDGY